MEAPDSLMSLLQVTEQLLFSFPLSKEIVHKYIYMRETAFSNIGLHCDSSHLWRLHSQQELIEPSKLQQGIYALKIRLQGSHGITKSYSDIVSWAITIVNMTSQRLKMLLGYAYDNTFQVPQYYYSLEKTDRTEPWQTVVQIFKDLQLKETQYMKLLTSDMEKQEKSLQFTIEELEKMNTVKSQQAERLQSQVDLLKESKVSEQERVQYKHAVYELERQIEDLKRTQPNYQSVIVDLEQRIQLIRKEEKLATDRLVAQIRKASSKQLQNLRNSYQQQLRSLKKQLENSKNFSDSSLKEKSDQLQLAFQRKVQQLQVSFQQKQHQLIEELEKLTNQDSSVVRDLRQANDRLQLKLEGFRQVLKSVSDKIHPLFSQFCARGEDLNQEVQKRKKEILALNDHQIWQNFADMVCQIDFIGHAIAKFAGDNDWLVDRLSEVTKELEDLKSSRRDNSRSISYDQIINSLSTNEIVMKEFLEARNKLVDQFSKEF